MTHKNGFTLAELLIALAILGVIATFTIPKVLVSQQNTKYKAIGKEVASMISGAYEAYRQAGNTVTAGMTAANLTGYMNYVSLQNTGGTDRWEGAGGSNTCGTATWGCLRLHNGATLGFHKTETMSCTTSNCAIYYHVDVDGVDDGVNDSVVLFLYSNGRITSWGTLATGTVSDGVGYGPTPANDPPWFGWN